MIALFSNGQLIRNGDIEDVEFTSHGTCTPKYWETVHGASHLVSKRGSCKSRASSLESLIVPTRNEEIVLFISNNHGHKYGETVGQELTDKLIKGHQYQISFLSRYSNGGNTNKYPQLITSLNIGKPKSFLNIPGSYGDTVVLSNHNIWIQHSFCFTAIDTGINYISFSNFNISQNKNADILIDNVEIKESPTYLKLGNDTTLCNGDTLTFDLQNEHISSYFWHGWTVLPSFKSSFSISKSGTYWAGVKYPCSIERDTITIHDIPPPKFSFDINLDSSLCIGDTVRLKAYYPLAEYLWQDNSIDTAYTVSEKGTYWVQITDQCDSIASDTITIDYHSPISIDLGEDIKLCRGDSIEFELLDSSLSYQWQDNSTQLDYTVYNKGIYWVNAKNQCETVSDTVKVNSPPIPLINSIEHQNSFILVAKNNIAENYQWIHCDSILISGENEPSYITSINGAYALIVERDGCIDTSNCITVGLNEIITKELSIFPNPTKRSVFINTTEPYNQVTVIIRTMLGQLIEEKQLSASDELMFELVGENGTYLIELRFDQDNPEFFRIIKQ